MFQDIFSYDPSSIKSEHRQQMARILKARGEFLRASAEISDLRGRAWVGEAGLESFIELKAADLAKYRHDYAHEVLPFLGKAVDLDGLKKLAPMLAAAVLQNFKVPLPILLEAVGVDFDNFKLLAESLKELINENL